MAKTKLKDGFRQLRCVECNGLGVVDCPSCEGVPPVGELCGECGASEENGQYAQIECPKCEGKKSIYVPHEPACKAKRGRCVCKRQEWNPETEGDE